MPRPLVSSPTVDPETDPPPREPIAPPVGEPVAPSPMARVFVRLVGPGGAPEPRAALWFTPLPGSDVVTLVPDSDGWVNAWLKPGSWRLEGRGPGVAGPLELTLTAGQVVRHTLQFTALRKIAGTVVDEAGAPITSARVRLSTVGPTAVRGDIARQRGMDPFARFSAEVYEPEAELEVEAAGYSIAPSRGGPGCALRWCRYQFGGVACGRTELACGETFDSCKGPFTCDCAACLTDAGLPTGFFDATVSRNVRWKKPESESYGVAVQYDGGNCSVLYNRYGNGCALNSTDLVNPP